jgi:hypothetical protein
MKNKRPLKPGTPALHVDDSVSLEEQIARRAHELFEQRSREHGNDLSDWLRAEDEVNERYHQRLRAQTAQQGPAAS